MNETAFEKQIMTSGLDLFYGETQVLKNISFDIGRKTVAAFIGPSGCGKSSYLRCLNRMNDFIASARVTGTIELDGENIRRYRASAQGWDGISEAESISYVYL